MVRLSTPGMVVMNLGPRCFLTQKLFSCRLKIADLKVVQMREAKVLLVSVVLNRCGLRYMCVAHVCMRVL